MIPNAETARNLADLLAALSPKEAERGTRLAFDALARWLHEQQDVSLDEAVAFVDQFADMVVDALEDNRHATRH